MRFALLAEKVIDSFQGIVIIEQVIVFVVEVVHMHRHRWPANHVFEAFVHGQHDLVHIVEDRRRTCIASHRRVNKGEGSASFVDGGKSPTVHEAGEQEQAYGLC